MIDFYFENLTFYCTKRSFSTLWCPRVKLFEKASFCQPSDQVFEKMTQFVPFLARVQSKDTVTVIDVGYKLRR